MLITRNTQMASLPGDVETVAGADELDELVVGAIEHNTVAKLVDAIFKLFHAMNIESA